MMQDGFRRYGLWPVLLASLILLLTTPAIPPAGAQVPETLPSVTLGEKKAAPPAQEASESPEAWAKGAAPSPADDEAFEAMLESTFTAPTGASPAIPVVKPITESVEPMNRGLYVFNDGVIRFFINPLQSGYKVIMPEPARKSIKKMGYNLNYPGRLINTLLQGEFAGAGVETGRFLLNTTVGLLGLFDPATSLGMRTYKADFGQTFDRYGAGQGTYLVLPFVGPSNGRDAIAWPFNAVLNPTTYFGGFFFSFNDMSFTLPTYNRIRKSDRDPYATVRDFTTLGRQAEVVDYQIVPPKDKSVPTLNAIFMEPRDPKFAKRGEERKTIIPSTNRWLPYTFWRQEHPAPVVYILPGVGSHRMASSAVALAELAYKQGFSAVIISSAMNWEFMENAGTKAVPGYTPDDARDVYVALNSIHRDLRLFFPGAVTKAALMGMSMGGLHTLFIASTDVDHGPNDLHFERFLAINPPVDLMYALNKLDGYYNAPLEWPAAERAKRIQDALYKAARVAQAEGPANPDKGLPFDNVESRYLIGLNYRLILRDIIYSSQKRDNMGVVKANLNRVSRQKAYDEIARFSYIDYIRAFVLPYYLYHPNFEVPRKEFIRKSNLWYLENELRHNPKIRALVNENDFLLRERDVEWLRSTLDERLTLFPDGGHLGNLHTHEVQVKIAAALADLVKK